MAFRVGQKVVCVDAEQRCLDRFPKRAQYPTGLKKGAIYTIAAADVPAPDGSTGVYLVETKSGLPPFRDGRDRPFFPDRFRPVVERKTDISIFTAMLTDKRQPVSQGEEVGK